MVESTPEMLAYWRGLQARAVAGENHGAAAYAVDVGDLLAALDTAIARAVAAERHLQEAKEALGIEPGDNLAHRIRMAKESGEHQVRAAEQRADAAELAWTELHRAAVSFEAPLSEWCDGPLRDALWKALAAKATDLAEALRRELLADGMDKAATELVEYYRVRAHRSGRVDEAQLLADLSDDITTTAAELRGPK